MKVNAVNPIYYARVKAQDAGSIQEPVSVEKPQINAIAFKSGNPKHVFHQISELSLFGLGSGGVGTVGNDLFFNHQPFDRVVENIPLYNQDVKYTKVIDPQTGAVTGIKQDGVSLRRIPKDLPADHPFKAHEGSVFITPKEITKDVNLKDFLSISDNAKSVYVLDEIQTSKMAWGLENEVPIGMYKAKKDEKLMNLLRSKGWSEEQIAKTDITFTYVDSTASMLKPYADGSYATATGDDLARSLSVGWQGKPYPKEAKATIELLPALKEKMGGFDPKFIMCHDGQAMPLIHFAAVKNATGDALWQDKVITAIGHNLNDGYMYNLGTKDAIVCLASPDEIKKIVNSKEYIDALVRGQEDDFLKSLLPKQILDGRGQINAVMFPIAYGEKGYVSMFTTVSEGYYKSIIENELVSPALFKRLQELSGQGRFKGIINVLMDPKTSGFTLDGLQDGYKNDCKIKLKDGKEVVIEKFKAFDEAKKYDLKHIRDVKRHNKISLLKRLDNNLKGAQLWSAKDNKWLAEGTGFSQAVTGGTGRKFELIGGIDPKYAKMLEQGKDVPMFVSWGRGDFQKGMDTGLEAFVKFVKKTGNKDAIYVFGGDMTYLKDVVELTKELNKDALFKGRIALLNGWTPGASFAAAGDYAALASRFAPCELTDLEAMKKGCIPIVPKVQGMDQKVFDPTDASHAQFINGYKGAHEYYMTEGEAFKAATKESQEAFTKVKDDVVKQLKKDYKSKIGEEIPTDLLAKQLKGHDKYNKALQKLRDSVISEDIASCMERAIKDRNTDVAEKLWKNHVDLKTTFEGNGWLTSSGKSTGQLFSEWHYNPANGKNLTNGDVLKLDLSKLTEAKSYGRDEAISFGSKIKNFFGSKSGKLTAAAVGLVALAGIGYGLYKRPAKTEDKPKIEVSAPKVENKPVPEKEVSVSKKKIEKKDETKHLSAVV